MRLPGYCMDCHRVRTVRVTRPSPRGVQTGICDDCQDKADDRADVRRTPIERLLAAVEPGTEKLLISLRREQSARDLWSDLSRQRHGTIVFRHSRVPGSNRWGVWASQPTELNEGTTA